MAGVIFVAIYTSVDWTMKSDEAGETAHRESSLIVESTTGPNEWAKPRGLATPTVAKTVGGLEAEMETRRKTKEEERMRDMGNEKKVGMSEEQGQPRRKAKQTTTGEGKKKMKSTATPETKTKKEKGRHMTEETQKKGKKGSRQAKGNPKPKTAWEKFRMLVPKESIPEGHECSEDGVTAPSGKQLAEAPFGVSATSRMEDGSGQRLSVEGIDTEGHLRQLMVERGALGNSRKLVSMLLARGLCINPTEGREISSYRAAFRPKRIFQLVNQPGWVGDDPFQSQCFCFGKAFIGKPAKGAEPKFEPIAGTRLHEALRRRGSLEQWQKRVAEPVRGLPLPMFSICAALSVPLAHILGSESLGYHFCMDSSSGKTTLLQIIASVFGRTGANGGSKSSLIQSWNSSPNALEILAHSCNDLPLVLDELKAGNVDALGGIIYMLAHGQGKQRMNASLGLADQYRWRVTTFSTGEIRVGDALEEVRKKVHAGQEIRLMSIPVEEKDFGEDSEKRVKELKESMKMYYGRAGWKFVDQLIEMLHDEDWTKSVFREELEIQADLLKQCKLSRERERATNCFALPALAGSIACRAGILPYSEEEVEEAVAFVHHHSPQTSPSPTP